MLQHYAIDTLFPTEWNEDKDTPGFQLNPPPTAGLSASIAGATTMTGVLRPSLTSASAVVDTGIVEGADPLGIKSTTYAFALEGRAGCQRSAC